MKKIISLVLAAGLLVGATAQTSEAKFSVAGSMIITGDFNSGDIMDAIPGKALYGNSGKTFQLTQRYDLSLNAAIAEGVNAHFRVRVPSNSNMSTVANANVFEDAVLRAAYIEFPVSMLNLRAGVQSYTLPGYLGGGVNPVLDTVTAGILLSADFGMITPEFSWFVPAYEATSGLGQVTSVEVENMYSLVLPINLVDGIAITPWATFHDKNTAASDTYVGATIDAVMSGINAGVGVLYAMTDSEASVSNLLISANASMNLGMLTPGIAVWYGMEGSDGAAVEFGGGWGAFNGTAETMFDNASGLQAANQSLVGFENSLGLAVSVNDVNLGETLGLGAYVGYVRANDQDVPGNIGKITSELGFGINLDKQIVPGLNFIVEGNGIMPLSSVDGGDLQLGTSIAGTLSYSF